jgi:3-methyladenine DNA glycosylase AlkD
MATTPKKKSSKKTAGKKAKKAATKKTGAKKSAGNALSFTQVMADLRAAGTAQNRKVYGRHGVTGEQFGVSFGFMRPYARKIGTDHALAEPLWTTGNHDARMLACMVGDGAKMSSKALDGWLKDIDNYVLCDAFSGLVARSEHALAKVRAWTKSKSEYTRRCGYGTLASLLSNERDVPADLAKEMLGRIEREIHASANRARESMNRTLICIGTYVDGFEAEAIAAAKRIGPVEVDHGETGCKTPDAASYIVKSAAHRKKKQRQR